VYRRCSVRCAKVIPDGKNLISHAGAALLAVLVDRSGLTEAMSGATDDCEINWHTHDTANVRTPPGDRHRRPRGLRVRQQEDLFGPVTSVATPGRGRHRYLRAAGDPLAYGPNPGERLGLLGGRTRLDPADLHWPDQRVSVRAARDYREARPATTKVLPPPTACAVVAGRRFSGSRRLQIA
jgi:hypothetical protein